MSCWLFTTRITRAEYRVEHEDIAKRTLRNACLRFLAFGETHLADVLVSKQYHEADNMTMRWQRFLRHCCTAALP